jgi:hypothetical protein
MKASKRIFHILLSILLLHGSTLGFEQKVTHSESIQHEETLLAIPTAQLSSYTSKHENYRHQFHILDHSFGDGTIFSTVCRLAEFALGNKLSASLELSKEHIVRLGNTTIIFPFHTFP